jgi:hypothetical protein
MLRALSAQRKLNVVKNVNYKKYRDIYIHINVNSRQMNYHDIFVRSTIDASGIVGLEKYMFFHLPDEEVLRESNVASLEIVSKEVEEKPMMQKDALFWIMYIHIYSKCAYDEITRYTNTMMEEKQKIAHFFNERPNAMKNVNIKITKSKCKELVSELMINNDITMETLHALAIFYKRKVVVYNDIVSYSIEPHDYDDTADVIQIRKKNKDYYMHDSVAKIDDLFAIERYDAPLKAISNYKVDELRNISKRLGITPEKNDKQSHYIEIVKRCIL